MMTSLASRSLLAALAGAICLLTAPAVRAQSVTSDGALRMEVITAYNFVVDSNIESPAGRSPSAAHVGVRIYNDGLTPLTNVVVNIGRLTNPATSTGTPGVFEPRTVDFAGQYSGTFALQMPGGAADAVRVIPRIEPGQYVAQYFFVVYPLKDSLGRSVTGAANVTADDLWLNYDIWAYVTDGSGTRRVNQTTRATMRNEISASANKIYPNGDNKVPEQYLAAIQAVLGWRPSTQNPRIPGASVSEGIWYDLGNVGAGFDNNGDGIPDRNVWMQPVGDPSLFNPLGARLVKAYGIVIVKLNDGTEQLIPFEDRLYFENLPANNTGAVGLVYYEFLPLNTSLAINLTPYQEVASGYDNEKFNADYGTLFPVSAVPPSAEILKTGPATAAVGSTVNYTLTTTNTGMTQFGWPDQGLPVVIEDPIPSGLLYVGGSAATSSNVTTPAGGVFTVTYSTNNGASWVTTEPSPATNVNRLRWTLDRPLQPTNTATVVFSATVPAGFTAFSFTNTAILKTGTETEVDRDNWTTVRTGNNSIGDFVWRDLDRDGVQDGGLETGIANVGVSLYVDSNGNGVRDTGEPLYATTSTSGTGAYLFSNLPDARYIVTVSATDPDLPYGYTLKTGTSDSFAVDLDSAGATTSPVNFLTADWPFIGALEVTKTVSPTTYNEGALITYDIHLDNHMLTVAPTPPSVQTVYATNTVFTANNADGKATEGQAAGAPNNVFTFIDWERNADQLVTSGISPALTQTGNITKVELIVRGYQSAPLVNDQLGIDIAYTGRAMSRFVTRTTAQMNALVGVNQDLVIDITSANAGSWTWAQAQSLAARLVADKTSAGDPGDYYVDSIGFRITTDAVPFTGSFGPNTIYEWPLKDTYDPAKLQFVTASVAPDVTAPAGTLEWFNLGPVNAGARKTITVTFRALSPTDTNSDGRRDAMTANNYVTTQGVSGGRVPLFANGLAAGHDDGSVDVTINPSGTIGDFVYWDVNANSVFNSGDQPLRGVIVQLFQGGVYTGRSEVTDVNGFYSFTGLADGTYTVRITTAAGDLFSLPWTTFTSLQRGVAGTTGTGFVQGDSVVINNSDFLTTNDTNVLQDFGFDSNVASLISGKLFRDWNGNGVQDLGEEPLVGVTVTLTGANSRTTTTDANGFYQFTNLTGAGNSTVTVTAPANHTQTLDPDGTLNNATTVNVVLGNAYTDRDFAYRPSGALSIGDTLYYDWNGNGTQDSGEGGIPNVTIRLYEDDNGDGVVNATDALVATAVSNASGNYQFTGLANGNYVVVVDVDDPDFPDVFIQTQDYDGLLDDNARINLTTSLNTVDFGYRPIGSSSIGNQVWLDFNNNGLRDSGEAGVNGVTVQLYRSTQTPGVDSPVATTTTSGGGLYSFTDLAPGGYYVYIPASNFGSGQPLASLPWSSTTTNTADDNTDNDDNGIQSGIGAATVSPVINLSAAENNQFVDFGFTGTASIGDRVFNDLNANGSLDFDETGINGVVLELYRDANQDNIPDGGFIATATTATVDGVTGFYAFTNIAPGTYIVQVRTSTLPAGAVQTADPDLDGIPVNNSDANPNNDGDHADTRIELFSGSNYTGADFGYQPPGSIGDFVWLDVDRDGVQDLGEPGIPGVVVRITNGTTTYNVTTDADGYWAQVVADGTWTVSIPTLPAGRVPTYDADSGTTSPNASVAVTVAGGNVTVPSGLAQGNLGLDFGLGLDGAYSVSGTVAINDTRTLGTHDDTDDFFDDGSDLDAGPLDETELAGVEVFLYTNAGVFLGSTFTDASGNYAFTNLPDGSYRVIIGTTAVPLDRATLTTSNSNYTNGTTVTDTGTTVIQNITVAGASLQDIDFMFVSNVDFDFGDLPAFYGITTLTQDGGRHIIPSGGSTLYMGIAPDAEANGAPSLTASTDDTTGIDDEGGVTFNTASWTNGAGGGSASVDVTGSGWLVAWIDWNRDGDFLDAGEMIADRAVSTGSVPLTFDIPAGTLTGVSQSWLSRFRLFPTRPAFPLFSYVGEATGGEIEDYLVERTFGGSIGDTVWADTDGDGVVDSGEAGLGGVLVELRDNSNALIASQTTSNGFQDVDGDGLIDPLGYYRFRNLAPGTYNIVSPNVPAGFTRSYDEDSGTASPNGTTQVVLGAGVQHLTADFGYQPLVASISGQVRYDADSDGDPGDSDSGAPGVRIQLWTDPDGDGDPSDGTQVGETFTNGSGNYTFTNVPSGNYVVVEVNPSGTTSTWDAAGANDDRIPVVLAGTNVTGRDFLDTTPPLYSIAGTVYHDSEGDNNVIDGTDSPLPDITVELYFDRDGNGVVSPGDTLITTTTTASNGTYSFSGLPAGNYVVQKVNPSGGSVTNDWDAESPLTDSQIGVTLTASATGRDFLIDGYLVPGTIGGRVLIDTNLDGTGDTPLASVTLTLVDAGGNPVLDGSNNPITTLTGGDGTYSFSNVPPGTYGVRATPVADYLNIGDKDGTIFTWIGDVTDIVLALGGESLDNDFLLRTQACPNTWEDWQAKWGTGASPLTDLTPTGNDDADIHNNLIEYAFCLDPKSGRGTPYCMSGSLESVDKVDLVFRRTAGGPLDITFELEHAATLGANSTTWTTAAIPPANIEVTRRTNGTDSVRIKDLEAITGLTAGTGFIRIKVTLRDPDTNNVIATGSTDVGGWIQTPLDFEIRSFNDPFLDCPLFTGTITAIEGQNIVTEVSGGGLDYAPLLAGQNAYAEILTGPLQGHRFDVAGGSTNRFTAVVDNDIYSGTAPFSTAASPQPELVGAQFVVRPHRTVGNVFPPRAFITTDDPESASIVQMYAGNRWETFWLYNDGGEQDAEPAWVAVGDSTLTDRSADTLVPGQGGFIYSRQGAQPGASFMLFGNVRPNDFIRPLKAGLNNVGGGYPLVQSPAGRAMTYSDPAHSDANPNGFIGTNDFKTADQFLIWRMDSNKNNAPLYDTWFLLNRTARLPIMRYWTPTSVATLPNVDAMPYFKPDYSILIKRNNNNPAPANRMPAPWKP